jgi:hypothetical protein
MLLLTWRQKSHFHFNPKLLSIYHPVFLSARKCTVKITHQMWLQLLLLYPIWAGQVIAFKFPLYTITEFSPIHLKRRFCFHLHTHFSPSIRLKILCKGLLDGLHYDIRVKHERLYNNLSIAASNAGSSCEHLQLQLLRPQTGGTKDRNGSVMVGPWICLSSW